MRELADLVSSCAVRIEINSNFAGSGVFVAPGQILTCAHVVATASQRGLPISIFHQGKRIPATIRAIEPTPKSDGPLPSPYGWPDLAWLEVSDVDEHPWALIGTVRPEMGEQLITYGFSESFHDQYPAGQRASYRVDGRVTTDVGERWQLSSAQAAPGMSGSGLIDPSTGCLFGLLTRTRDADTDAGGWAVSIDRTLWEAVGFSDLLEQIQPSRARNPREAEDWRRNDIEWLYATGIREFLITPYEALPMRHTPATLLRPRHGVVPFHPARRSDLLALVTWCTNEGEPLVRLVTGPAGTGKTRLAAELADELASAGWLTGFLQVSHSLQSTSSQLSRCGRPILIIVDYAETYSKLADLLADAARLDENGVHLRLLLLARTATDWWQEVNNDGNDPARIAQALVGARVAPLSQLDVLVDNPAEAYKAAVAALASRQGIEEPATLPPLTPAETWSFLSIHLAALDAVGTPDQPARSNPEGVPRSPSVVLDHVMARERRHWRRTADRDPEHLPHVASTVLARVVAILSLIPTPNETTAAAVLMRVPDLAAPGDNGVRHALARWMAHQYPPDRIGTWTSGLQPDLLAESHCATTLAAAVELPVATLAGLDRNQGHQALTVLTRAARHNTAAEHIVRTILRADLEHLGATAFAVATETGQPMDRVLAHVLGEPGLVVDGDLLEELADAVPERTIALREAAAVIDGRMVETARRSGEQAKLASSLNNLSVRLGDLGLMQDALNAIQEGVEINRSLAATDPETYEPILAGSLNNLAILLSDVGKIDDELVAIKEAVRLHRNLSNRRGGRFSPELAMSLNNLSNTLGSLGQHGDGLIAIEEAINLYRDLAADNPITFTHDLAMSLNNQAIRLNSMGRDADALTAIREATDLYRVLAADRPDASTPDLAGSLNNLSNLLERLGHHEAALSTIEEAARLYRALAADRPNAFLADVAMTLNNLSNRLDYFDRHDEAMAAIEEAIQHYRTMTANHSEAFTPHLAGALNNLSNRLTQRNRHHDAFAAVDEATELYLVLAADHPESFTSDLAMSFNNLSNGLSHLDRHDDALTAITEATRLYRGLAAKQPDAFTSNLAMCLSNLANRLTKLDRYSDALNTNEEASQLYRDLAAKEPDAYTSNLAISLSMTANTFSQLGQYPDALIANEEATQLYRNLATRDPDAYTPSLAMSLSNLANRLGQLGRHAEALTPILEAVDLRRSLVVVSPGTFTPDLARSLVILAARLRDCGQLHNALTAIEEACDCYSSLVVDQSGDYTMHFVNALTMRGMLLTGLSRHLDALVVDERCVDLVRGLHEAEPHRHRVALSAALENLIIDLRVLGRDSEAQQAESERAGLIP